MAAPLLLGTPTTREQIEKGIADLKRWLAVVDRRLGEAPGGYFAAGRFTIADVAHVGVILLLEALLGEGVVGCGCGRRWVGVGGGWAGA